MERTAPEVEHRIYDPATGGSPTVTEQQAEGLRVRERWHAVTVRVECGDPLAAVLHMANLVNAQVGDLEPVEVRLELHFTAVSDSGLVALKTMESLSTALIVGEPRLETVYYLPRNRPGEGQDLS